MQNASWRLYLRPSLWGARIVNQFFNAIVQHIVAPSRITGELFLGLLTPFGRSPHLRRHAAAVIIARVQFISALFALLVPMWSLVDLLVFPPGTALMLVGLRFGSAAVFVALAWPRPISARNAYLQAMLMLLAMLMVPPLFYLVSTWIIDPAGLSRTQQLVAQLYAYMPTVVLGGLAIFPLTALEILLFSLPVVGVGIVGMLAGGASLSLELHGAGLWFMLMMIGVSMFSGMSQSHYMESLVHKAMTDPLTGAYTRRSGVEALDLMLRLTSMSGKPLTVAFLDVDHFKQINDTFGHDAGDKVLCALVEHVRASLRRSDVLIRWGGEEFVLVLPDMPAASAPALLDRLRAGLGERPDGAPLTVSIGVAESLVDEATGWEALVERADARMYEAKRQGRNRVIGPLEAPGRT